MDDAVITDVQRFSVHDGPGIRTTVFFKGCPLDCIWCHNPEAIAFTNEVLHVPGDCISCGECLAACGAGACAASGGRYGIDRERCRACLECTRVCPSGARRPAAQRYTADELLRAVSADRDFYGGDGGVTLSGGEPFAQPGFLEQFLPRAKAEGLHVTAQTCGHWAWDRVAPLLERIDLVQLDIKAIDPERHRLLTGRSNETLLGNLERIARSGALLQVRIPLVGGCNADAQNLEHTARLLERLGLESVTLLPYHRLGEGKRAGLARGVAPRHRPRPPDDSELALARRIFSDRLTQVEISSRGWSAPESAAGSRICDSSSASSWSPPPAVRRCPR